jgi:hypothetical protein
MIVRVRLQLLLCAELCSDPLRTPNGRKATRLNNDHGTSRSTTLVRMTIACFIEKLRDLRCFAASGRPNDNHNIMVTNFLHKLLFHFIDWQGSSLFHHKPWSSQCHKE